MTAEDTARALMAMSDQAVRSAVAHGDMAALGGLELSTEEQRILFHAARDDVAAADDDGDVEGFGGTSTGFAPPYVPVGPVVSGMVAIRYVEDNLAADAPIRTEFGEWAAKFSHGSW